MIEILRDRSVYLKLSFTTVKQFLTTIYAQLFGIWINQSRFYTKDWRAMESQMIGISRREHKTNQWVRNPTQALDVIEPAARLKWKCVGQMRMIE